MLHSILGFRIAPPVVGRKLNLTQLKPITTTGLQATYLQKGMTFTVHFNSRWPHIVHIIQHINILCGFKQCTMFSNQMVIYVSMGNVTTASHQKQRVQRGTLWRAPSLSGYLTGTSSPQRDTPTRGHTGMESKRAGRETTPTARGSCSNHHQSITMEYWSSLIQPYLTF